MSTPSTNYEFPIPTPFSDSNVWGNELNTSLTFLDTYLLALAQNFYGASAPTIPDTETPAAGQFWLNSTTNPYPLSMYTGTNWVQLGTLNVSTNVWTPVGSSLTLNPVVITSNGTYTPNANLKYALVTVVAGGGGGGGAAGNGISPNGGGAGGGGGGGYAQGIFSAATIGANQSVTVGTGGAGGSGSGNGSNGTSSSFGALLSATGGAGGEGVNAATGSGNIFLVKGGAGGAGSSGSINTNGAPGGYGTGAGSGAAIGGIGGSTLFGGGAYSNKTTNGIAGLSYGGGGSGASVTNSSSILTGGTGAGGVVYIIEYI